MKKKSKYQNSSSTTSEVQKLAETLGLPADFSNYTKPVEPIKIKGYIQLGLNGKVSFVE